jgi:hypothetical protein
LLLGRPRRFETRLAAPCFQTGQQTKHLTALQTEQFAGIRDTQTAGLHAQQDLEPVEFLLAHRHHRHRAPPEPPNPGQCRVNFAEGCHLYIAVTTLWRISGVLENQSGTAHVKAVR